MNTSQSPSLNCPTCGKLLDAATAIDTRDGERVRPPKPKDITICFGCSEVLVFNSEMKLEIPSISDLLDLDEISRAQIDRAQTVIRRSR